MKGRRHRSAGRKGRQRSVLSVLEPETRMGCVVTAAWPKRQGERAITKTTAVGMGCQAGPGAEKSTGVCPGLAHREPGAPLSLLPPTRILLVPLSLLNPRG